MSSSNMQISEDLRRNYLGRISELERAIRSLVSEMLEHMPPAEKREFRRRLGSKADVLFADMERAVSGEPDDLDGRAEHMRDLSDELISTRADLENIRRRNRDDMDALELKRRRMEHLDSELSAGS